MNNDLIQKALNDGHALADKLEKVDNLAELDALEKEIEKYSDFIEDAFGVLNEFDEKDCDLATELYIALDWKRKSLYPENKDYPPALRLAKDFREQFVEYLDSLDWVVDK